MGRKTVLGAAATAVAAAALVGVVVGGTSEPAPPTTPAAGSRVPAVVNRVVDGDTVRVTTRDNPDLDVRIVGMNAPESVGSRPKGCGGQQASAFAKEALPEGTQVTLVADPKVRSSQRGTPLPVDRYGRTLAYVELRSGQNFALEAVSAGLSEFNDYGSRLTLDQAFSGAQRDAQAQRRGIWGETVGAPGETGAGQRCTPATSYPGR